MHGDDVLESGKTTLSISLFHLSAHGKNLCPGHLQYHMAFKHETVQEGIYCLGNVLQTRKSPLTMLDFEISARDRSLCQRCKS